MTRQLVTFKPETTLFEAMNVMLEKRISGAPVVDEAGAILGIISEIDFLDAMLKAAYYGQLEGAVGDFMTAGAETIDASMDLYEAAKLFIGARRRRLPVLQNGRLVGQLSRRDLLRAIRDWSAPKP
jgi:Predicted transcriptional regulator, contains C-terminal CBS domains